MRDASTYRGARRNAYRRTSDKIRAWRNAGYDEAANARADLGQRSYAVSKAREHVSKALVAAGALAGPSIVNYAFLDFYLREKRTRVVNRIISTLLKALPPVRKRAA